MKHGPALLTPSYVEDVRADHGRSWDVSNAVPVRMYLNGLRLLGHSLADHLCLVMFVDWSTSYQKGIPCSANCNQI